MAKRKTYIFGGIALIIGIIFNTGYFAYKSIGKQPIEKVIIEKTPILPKEIRIETAHLNKNESVVLYPGQYGELTKVFKLKNNNGVALTKELMWAKVFKKPVPKRTIVGTSDKKKLYPMKRPMHVKKTMIMRATAYYPGPEDCGPYANGYTYMDYKAAYGVVAVDPRVIKLGTKVYVEGYGYALAVDIGGAIKGNKIDLCYNTRKESLRYGVKKVKVHILN